MKEIIYTVMVDSDGNKFWYLNNKLHRNNGPAFEWKNSKIWYLNGLRHRVDGPAYENCYKSWYLRGEPYNTNNRTFKISANSNCFRLRHNNLIQ